MKGIGGVGGGRSASLNILDQEKCVMVQVLLYTGVGGTPVVSPGCWSANCGGLLCIQLDATLNEVQQFISMAAQE